MSPVLTVTEMPEEQKKEKEKKPICFQRRKQGKKIVMDRGVATSGCEKYV
jgi:hypothetical protein